MILSDNQKEKKKKKATRPHILKSWNHQVFGSAPVSRYNISWIKKAGQGPLCNSHWTLTEGIYVHWAVLVP